MEEPINRDIDLVIEQLRVDIPGIRIQQLRAVHRGVDDDGLWFIEIPGQQGEVQLESSYGMFPFLIESDFSDERSKANNVEEVAATVKRLYGLS